jgi:hypothetical protein
MIGACIAATQERTRFRRIKGYGSNGGSLWKSGLQMAAIGLFAGLLGFLIGHFIGTTPV